MSAFKLSKGFSSPIAAKLVNIIFPEDVWNARYQLQACRKLALFLGPKFVSEVPIAVRDIVEVCQKNTLKREQNGQVLN